ncbi:MAG: LPS export ABC transporter permease LptG [Halioglobus sp.]
MILQRYIGLNLVKGWLLALAVLSAIFGLLLFIEELDKVTDSYTATMAAHYAIRVLPNQLIGLAPVIALLGSIVALASMDRSNELTTISTSGFGRAQLIAAITFPTLLLMGLLWLNMEYVTPQLQQAAEQDKLRQRHGDTAWIPRGGVWSTDGNRYINLQKLSRDIEPGKISLYEFDDDRRLLRTLRAESARISSDRDWRFQQVREKVLVEGEFQNRNQDELEVPNLWARNELPTLTVQGDSMNLSVLYNYAQYLENTQQPAERYLHAFWQKLMMPFTVLAMVLLATPVSASATAGRDRSFGFNLGIGVILGILFYLGAQIVFALGQLLGWNIPLVAALPAIITFAAGLLMFRRMRW